MTDVHVVLEKVGKEKNNVEDSNSQTKKEINDLKATMSALKITLICGHKFSQGSDF